MTIQEITTRKENLTFDCKSIQINPKALAVPIVAFANVIALTTSKVWNYQSRTYKSHRHQ